MQTSLSRGHTRVHLLHQILTKDHCFPLPQGQEQRTKDSPVPQSPWKLFRSTCLKPAYPVSPLPSHANHNNGSCPHFPVLPLSSYQPTHAAASTHASPQPPRQSSRLRALLWEPEVTNHVFNGSHLLICWPHQTCTLKHLQNNENVDEIKHIWLNSLVVSCSVFSHPPDLLPHKWHRI